jgi:hypothetical protein
MNETELEVYKATYYLTYRNSPNAPTFEQYVKSLHSKDMEVKK